jgi:hypothetical protein
MARPEITGVGGGERLKVVWPGAGWGSSGPREHSEAEHPGYPKRLSAMVEDEGRSRPRS